MSKPDFYMVSECVDGTWGFITPTRRAIGFPTKARAAIAAAAAEQDDREEAEKGSGAIAEALRKHFSPEPQPAVPG